MIAWFLEDRRNRRSKERTVALRYQLERAREHAGLEALVLVDRAGSMVASSGDRAVCAELGAMAPLMERTLMPMPMPPLLRGGEIAIRKVPVCGNELLLACVGGGVARDAHMKQSVAGVRRILASN